ncbi:hypothetical protein [Castellaniella sp. UC4442_H9]
MPQDDISALSAKLDFLIGRVKELEEQVKENSKRFSYMQRQFDESKGALGLIKTMAWLAGIGAAVWVAFHGGRP